MVTTLMRTRKLTETVGAETDALPRGVRESLLGLARNLDAAGRLQLETEVPSIDGHTLRAALASLSTPRIASHSVSALRALPGRSLREELQLRPPPVEVSWFDLAERVTVYDAEPQADLGDLALDKPRSGRAVAAAVRARFPSLELELLEVDQLPRALSTMSTKQKDAWLHIVTRQLGWWAAMMGAVLIALAHRAHRSPASGLVWPYGMFMLSAAVGGWTLTVLGNCALAPVD